MFDEILGLPAHPLIIHAAVVFAPLVALLSLLYAVASPWRPYLGWAVASLAVITPAVVFAAKQSGEALEISLYSDRPARPEVAQAIAEHSAFADPLLYASLGLGAVALLLVLAGRRLPKVVDVLLSIVVVALAGVVGFYVFQAGHSGAEAVWLF